MDVGNIPHECIYSKGLYLYFDYIKFRTLKSTLLPTMRIKCIPGNFFVRLETKADFAYSIPSSILVTFIFSQAASASIAIEGISAIPKNIFRFFVSNCSII